MDSSNHLLGRRMGKKEDFQNQLGSAGREEVEPSDLVHTESNRSRFVVAGKRINSSRLAMQSTRRSALQATAEQFRRPCLSMEKRRSKVSALERQPQIRTLISEPSPLMVGLLRLLQKPRYVTRTPWLLTCLTLASMLNLIHLIVKI